MPPIWSVESDDPNLAAVLERLVDIKKGNTLVRGPGCWGGACVLKTTHERGIYLESGWCSRLSFGGRLLRALAY